MSVLKSNITIVVFGLLLFLAFPGFVYSEVSSDTNANFTSIPINLTGNDVTPLVMLNASRDHQLSYKAYNDYSDLDNDGIPEKTYDDSIEYYGYFDSAKCYNYSTTNERFEPDSLVAGTYDPSTGTHTNHYCTGQWSGNFMNWATMTRMDVVRKLLYGGKRSTDTSTLTVLERQYLPTDAHAFAKYYDGDDIDQLTPFSGVTTESSNAEISIPNHSSGTEEVTFTTSLAASVGDYIKAYVTTSEDSQWMIGEVDSTGSGTITIEIPYNSYDGAGTYTTWTLKNLSRSGITLGNLTLGGSGSDSLSQTNDNPPLVRVARGNFQLWATNERWQCYWSGEKTTTNGNDPFLSGLYAASSNPSKSTHGLGEDDYIVRIEVADSLLPGNEKIRQYGSSYKPIGLLQVYGDSGQINFGLMTGTFDKNISGGVLRKNIESFANEIDPVDGTFTGGGGIVDNLDKIRIHGYSYGNGGYTSSSGDNCKFQQTGLVPSGGSGTYGKPANEGDCASWGNPMSEIYLESLRYLAGKSATSDFEDGFGSKDADMGLTLALWSDPLNATNYCAPLNIINFNASISSNDGDQMSGISDLGSTLTASEWTDKLGEIENIDESSWFVSSNGAVSDDLCTSKDIGSGFGSFSGLCPEGPTQQGTYLMSGTAYYANTNRIRSDLTVPSSRSNSRDLKVSTYGVALSTNVPKIEVEVGDKKVTILPAFRLQRATSSDPYGSGSLIDFKIIERTASYGKFYVNWEVSAMGGDHDQDVWGIIEYSVSGSSITITTDSIAQSASREQGFGYTISGTNKDGVHFHSGQNGFDFTDPTGVLGCTNCNVGDGPSSVTYAITGSSAGVLEDPLWYTAKYGGFIDSNSDNIPQQEEWDVKNNSDGSDGPDGQPDNFFYATNPLQLENSLNRVFLAILQRSSSGTAAAVVSNNVSGVGALYQAYYEPMRQDADNNKVSWIGTVQALWLDDYGYLREDDGDAVLDGYLTDKVIQLFYDEVENKTKVRRYTSTEDDEFVPYFMQGTVTAYNAGTGTVEFKVETNGGSGGPFDSWTVENLSSVKTGNSSSSISVAAVNTEGVSLTVTPTTTSFAVGDEIRVAHFETDVVSLEDVGTLWNARKYLSFSGAAAEIQRDFDSPIDNTDSTSGGRFIKTWIDTNNNGTVDSGEFIDFDSTKISSSNFGFLNVATEANADALVDYVRGKVITGYRNRTIDYDGDGSTEVMRLADIVNSTPTVVGAPQEAIDLLYKDSSYVDFKKRYAKRRQVLYTGSNGGMLHAFNGGFYNSATRSFKTAGKKPDGTTNAVEHPLGAELWAYVPMNLLPHLKWLKDTNYTHVYYVDGKPKVFDAKIFTADTDHPNGWGTVLAVGMRFGGGSMTVDVDPTGTTDNRDFSSAYIIMDITNPEVEPKLLAEIQVPDGSFSTSYPTALTVNSEDKWFLLFGSGPTSLGTAESDHEAKLYAIDLSNMSINTYDTGVANSFVGDPISVDWQLDYDADNVYFGVVGDQSSTSGRVQRLSISGSSWTGPLTVINTSQPVVSSVTPAVDESGQKWLFFGTGRLFVSADQLSTATQSIYGVKESGAVVDKTDDLVNVTAAQVETNGDLTYDVGDHNNTTFNSLVDDIATNFKGWYLDLPPINGIAGTAPATRVINSSALVGGVLFTTAYQPGLDLCTGEGFSRLYGLYYKSGTANPAPAILGTEIDTSGVADVEYAKTFQELGFGFATTPSLHSGSGTGDDAVNVFTQLSTGSIIQTEASTVSKVRSGWQWWRELR